MCFVDHEHRVEHHSPRCHRHLHLRLKVSLGLHCECCWGQGGNLEGLWWNCGQFHTPSEKWNHQIKQIKEHRKFLRGWGEVEKQGGRGGGGTSMCTFLSRKRQYWTIIKLDANVPFSSIIKDESFEVYQSAVWSDLIKQMLNGINCMEIFVPFAFLLYDL